MTDFDKLIKEKAEQVSYPYNEVAWKQYKRKAGLHSGRALYWGVGASAVMVTGALLLFNPARHKQPMPEPQQTVVVANDSVQMSQNLSDAVIEDTQTLQVEQKTNRSTSQVSRNDKGKTIGHQSVVVKDTPKVSRKTVLGRPIVIDVDTITRMVPTDEELEKGHSRLY